MTTLDVAQRVVLEGCAPLGVQSATLSEALGKVLAEPVVAPHPVPPFTTSSMDGYALIAADAQVPPAQLKVIGHLLAGSAPSMEVQRGEAVRIMTGAPLPPGADAVCMVEHTRTEGDGSVVFVDVVVAPGTSVRRAGEDITAGAVVFDAGEVLGPGQLGVLASLGVYRPLVHRRAKVGVLSTGDELTEAPGALAPGRIRDANRYTLLARLASDGHEVEDLGIVGDDPQAITDVLLRGAASCDALVSSGGVSVGDVDYVKVVLDRLSGGSMRWMQIAIRPARPLAFGTLAEGGTPVFGLPGNPVSALVSYELFVRPALRQMGGHRELERPRVVAIADAPLERRPDGKLHLVRVVANHRADGRVHVRPSGAQESHLLWAMARANGLALVPDGEGIAQGATVEVLLTDAGEMAPVG